MKRSTKVILPLLLLSSLLSVSGVCALWEYSRGTVDNQYVYFQHEITDFYYPENLPTDDVNELDHSNLLELIISFSEGLNAPNSLLSKAIEDRKGDYNDVSSNQQVSGGNLKNTFSNVEGCENVGFLIYFDSETQYSIYTFDNAQTTTTGIYIETYKTLAILKEGTWVLSGGYKGEAEVCKYDGKTNGPYKNTIYAPSWVRTE